MGTECVEVENIEPQVDCFVFSDGHGVVSLAFALIELLKNWKETTKYENEFAFGRSALLLVHGARPSCTSSSPTP